MVNCARRNFASNPICLECMSPQLLAYCSELTNQITVVDLETKEEYIQFEGVTVRGAEGTLGLSNELII